MSVEIRHLLRAECEDLILCGVVGTLSAEAEEIMLRSVRNSIKVWSYWVDEGLVCLWGLIAPTILSEEAYLWMLTTEKLDTHTFMFIRHSRLVTEEMLKFYPIIVGHCALTATKAQRWIEWCGGKFGKPNGPLIPFEIRKS
jgi:hypothetical protein